jgi:hypothetical protein
MSGDISDLPTEYTTHLVGANPPVPIDTEVEATIHTPDLMKTDSTIHSPEPIKTDSTIHSTELIKTDSTIHSPDLIKTDSTIHIPETIKTDSKSEIDLKPLAVDSCTTIKLAPTCIEQPYSQRVSFTFMGVELFGINTSSRTDTFLNKPSPPAAHVKHHEHWDREHRDRRTPPTVVGRPRGISVRVIDD